MSIARIKAGWFCFFVMVAIALTSCRSHSDLPSNRSHALKDFRKVRLNHGVALLFEDEGHLVSYHPLIEQEVRRTIEVVAAKWDIGRLSIRVFASQTNVNWIERIHAIGDRNPIVRSSHVSIIG